MSEFDPRDASAKSAELRARRAEIKRELATKQRDVLETFDQARQSDDPAISGLRVEWFLRALPAIGPTKAGRILDKLGISPRATIGGLRINQRTAFRRELVRLLGTRRASTGQGRLVVIAGPTAVGKGTVVREVKRRIPDIEMSVSATTRPARPGETDGVDYFFVTAEEFDRMVAKDQLLEWAWVHGAHRYGTPRDPVVRQKRAGKTIFLEIDVQGARQIRARGEDALFIFIAPPSFEALAERLASRGTEDDAERQRRLATAVEELSARNEFDVVIVNDVVDQAAADIVDLLQRDQTRGD